ncbi:MAG: hypothetical protein KDK10_00845 [Maritimibacter sp.]|nr:hypothetical protein [Maritimibacter sp.]
MARVIAYIIGAVLIVVGVLALWGAVELWRRGGDTEALAQGFLVPASLFVVGGFVIWMGRQAGRR